jgi:uncharacterized protein YecT (DUF1311 family)
MKTTICYSRLPLESLVRGARLLLSIASIVLVTGIRAQAFEPPGTKEQADVDSANTVLDGVYRELMAKANPEEKTGLREAQRAWIKWRDAEAMYIARHGGAIGGSALRVDYATAELKLIKERIAVLKAYKAQPTPE